MCWCKLRYASQPTVSPHIVKQNAVGSQFHGTDWKERPGFRFPEGQLPVAAFRRKRVYSAAAGRARHCAGQRRWWDAGPPMCRDDVIDDGNRCGRARFRVSGRQAAIGNDISGKPSRRVPEHPSAGKRQQTVDESPEVSVVGPVGMMRTQSVLPSGATLKKKGRRFSVFAHRLSSYFCKLYRALRETVCGPRTMRSVPQTEDVSCG